MAWLDDRIQTHPKIVGVSDRAFRAWINGLCYCSMHGTGGQLDAAIRVHRIPKTIVRELVRAGVWDEEDDGTIWVHDWQEHNDKRDATREEKREQARERQRRHREKVRKARDALNVTRDCHANVTRDKRDKSVTDVTPVTRDSHADVTRGGAPAIARAHAGAPLRRQEEDQEPKAVTPTEDAPPTEPSTNGLVSHEEDDPEPRVSELVQQTAAALRSP